MLKIFVYGTLKPEESNYQEYCSDRVSSVVPALVQGKLFALPLGYPALLWDEIGGSVQGYLLTFFTPEILQSLDQLEEYQEHRPPRENAYQRRTIEVFTNSRTELLSLGIAWIYVMEQELIHQLGGTFLPEGYWTSGQSKG